MSTEEKLQAWRKKWDIARFMKLSTGDVDQAAKGWPLGNFGNVDGDSETWLFIEDVAASDVCGGWGNALGHEAEAIAELFNVVVGNPT